MTRHSLRFRLLVAAIVSVVAALLIAGMGLVVMFERHVERRIGAELETYLKQIIAGVDVTADGRINFSKDLADPRFNSPFSGLYWQIQDEERPTLLRSRSLWDEVVALPKDKLALGSVHRHLLPGPAEQSILVRERRIMLQPDGDERQIRIAVAADKRSLIAARNAFAADMLPYLLIMAAVLLTAAWVQIRIGLAPLDAVRRGVMEIRSGATQRLERAYPDELMPLVDEMNGLLEAQDQAIGRAREWTADLAHGLKTPLMVLTADSQRLREIGKTSIADDLDQLAATMRKRLDRELIRARVRSGAQARRAHADAGASVEGVVRALKRTPRGARLNWSVKAPDDAHAAILSDDLTELLGNILENAAQWANTAVCVRASESDAITITIEDDGPGVPQDRLGSLSQRGLRLDEQRQGFGLGLAIARDIAEAYHGDLAFSRASMGGLRVTVRLPVAD